MAFKLCKTRVRQQKARAFIPTPYPHAYWQYQVCYGLLRHCKGFEGITYISWQPDLSRIECGLLTVARSMYSYRKVERTSAMPSWKVILGIAGNSRSLVQSQKQTWIWCCNRSLGNWSCVQRTCSCSNQLSLAAQELQRLVGVHQVGIELHKFQYQQLPYMMFHHCRFGVMAPTMMVMFGNCWLGAPNLFQSWRSRC